MKKQLDLDVFGLAEQKFSRRINNLDRKVKTFASQNDRLVKENQSLKDKLSAQKHEINLLKDQLWEAQNAKSFSDYASA